MIPYPATMTQGTASELIGKRSLDVFTAMQALCPDEINAQCAILAGLRRAGGTLFVCGNGGSMATAAHFANDMSAVLSRYGKPLRTVALGSNAAFATCSANDNGYERLFVDELRVFAKPGDAVLVISASGNSANILAALREAPSDMSKLGWLGCHGGEALQNCDHALVVNSTDYQVIEDCHMLLAHGFYVALQKECPGYE